jgi:hypothetical protein
MGHIPKYKIPVRLFLLGEGTVLGVIFVRQEQRVIDMLCDQRPFFPVNTKTGMLLVNKSSVVKIDVLESEFILQNQDAFPDVDAKLDFQTHAALAKRRMRNEMEIA